MPPAQNPQRRTASTLIALVLLFSLLAAAQTAHAGPRQQVESTPTVEVDTEGTPALLLTPLPTLGSKSELSKPGALFATVALLLCGMVGMLVGGIGIAVVMVRVRNRIKR